MSALPQSRRPIPSRTTAWAAWMTRRLDLLGATPNQVSAAGLVFAVMAGAALAASAQADGMVRFGALLTAPVLIGLRLLANMLDGLLAVEAGKGAPDGPLWNELPDRVSDVAVLVGAGYGAGAPELGWAAASAALLTAHTRALGDAFGAPAGFSGPMAKPQRMAVVAAAAVASALASANWPLEVGLWIVVVASTSTAWRRTKRLRNVLLAQGAQPVAARPSQPNTLVDVSDDEP